MLHKKSAKTIRVQIDNKLLRKVMTLTGHRSERRVVEAGLRMLIRTFDQMKAATIRAEQSLDETIAYCDASNERIQNIDTWTSEQALPNLVKEGHALGSDDNPSGPRASKKKTT